MLLRHPLVKRFFSKLVMDAIPAVLASVLGGYLFTHYHFGWGFGAAPATAERSTAASVEMMELVRDEHALILDYLKAQLEAEKSKLSLPTAQPAGGDTAPVRAAVDTEPAASVPAARRATTVAMVAEPVPPRQTTNAAAASMVTAPDQPLAIAPAADSDAVERPGDPANPLVATTIKIKDHVVFATQRVVATIGGIPSWIVSVGERIGG